MSFELDQEVRVGAEGDKQFISLKEAPNLKERLYKRENAIHSNGVKMAIFVPKKHKNRPTAQNPSVKWQTNF